MIVNKTSPKGEDYHIDRLQKWIQPILFERWGLDPEDPADNVQFIFYPRVNRALDPTQGFIAELYQAPGKYKEVFFNDAVKGGLCFFGLGPKNQAGPEFSVDVHLIVFARLDTLYPGITHRADAEIRQDFQVIFKAPILGFTLVSTEIWMANVLKEYTGSRRESRLLGADQGRNHAFRLNLRLKYDPSCSS